MMFSLTFRQLSGRYKGREESITIEADDELKAIRAARDKIAVKTPEVEHYAVVKIVQK